MHASLLPVSLALCSSLAIGQCTIDGIGTPDPAAPTDGWSGVMPIGFPFPFNGATYTDFCYSDHGLIALVASSAPAGGGSTYDPGATQFDDFGTDVIAAYWGDHSTQGYGNVPAPPAGVWIDNTSGNHLTVSWIDNEPYDSYAAGAFSCSATLFPTGEIRIRLDSRANNTSSTYGSVTTVVGVHQYLNPIPASEDLSTNGLVCQQATCFEEFVGPGPSTTNTPDPNFDLTDTTVTFVPAGNNTWVVLNSTTACAASTAAGIGCSGLTLTSPHAPYVGTSWDLALNGVSAPAPFPNFVIYGNSTAATPVGLLFPNLFGASCNAYVDGAFGIHDIGPATAGVATTSLPIPSSAPLTGLTLTAQGLSLVGTTFGLSDAQTCTVGY